MALPLSVAWLSSQRWFRGRGHPPSAVALVDAAPLGDGPGWLLVLAARQATGDADRYLVPAVAEGAVFREPRDGDGVWQRIAGLMTAGGTLHGAGRFEFEPVASPAAPSVDGAASVLRLEERQLRIQQSNTSVALGDTFLLKMYRLVEPGVNPEVEVNQFLTRVAFADAPALYGTGRYLTPGGVESAAFILQQFMASSADAWTWALRSVAGQSRDSGPEDGMRHIGSMTRELHAALASRPAQPGFPARAATSVDLASWRAGAERQLEAALAAVGDAHRGRLAALADRIQAGLAAIDRATGATLSRIHGDYHLGQLLQTSSGFKVVDFEGEPARPLDERRQPASPLRDVAGMLRSIDYAARVSPADVAPGRRDAWAERASTAFRAGYGAMEPEPLVRALQLEKACYEVRYEASQRPAWVEIPLAALERLTG